MSLSTKVFIWTINLKEYLIGIDQSRLSVTEYANYLDDELTNWIVQVLPIFVNKSSFDLRKIFGQFSKPTTHIQTCYPMYVFISDFCLRIASLSIRIVITCMLTSNTVTNISFPAPYPINDTLLSHSPPWRKPWPSSYDGLANATTVCPRFYGAHITPHFEERCF